MGLSDEERLSRFYFGATRFRKHLKHLKSILRRADNGTIKLVDGYIEELDLIVGMVIQKSDSTSSFWFAGMPEDSYASLFHGEGKDLAQAGLPDEPDLPFWVKEGSLGEFIREYDLVWLAEHSCQHLNEWDEITCKALAMWWTAWEEIGNFFYAVNRYHDDLFGEEVKTRLLRLVGRMANGRYRLTGDGYEESDTKKANQIEQLLLGRHQAFQVALQIERTRLGDQADIKPFDRWDFLEAFQSKSLFDIHQMLEGFRAKEREQKYESQKPGPDKHSGLHGPPMPTRAELEKTIDTTGDRVACEKAVKQLEVLYNCCIGGWERRFDKGAKNGPKVPAGRARPGDRVRVGKRKRAR